MLANVFTKSIRDRRISTLVGILGIISVAVLGLAAYSDLDEQIADLYGGLPEGFMTLLGLEGVADTGSLIMGEIANLMAPMILAGLAISMGAAAVAGEERRGTFGVLLGNPKSRTSVLISKTAAMIALTSAAAAVAGLGSMLVAQAFGSDPGTFNMTAAMLHVVVISLFFGFLALFLGAWTGNSALASGTSAGVLLLSFMAAGLLPLIDSLADLAKIFPWYYFNSSRPLDNGVDWGHLGILFAAIAVLGVGAIIGLRRRDLKVGTPSGALAARIQEHPIGAKVLSRLSGRVNVSTIALKAISDHRVLTTIAGLVILYTALLVGPMYNGLSDVLVEFSAAIPEALKAMIGYADMATPEGWYNVEVFSIVVPAALIAVGATVGARALAGEEENHTMDMLLANPIKRSRVVLEKAISLSIIIFSLAAATFLGVWLGSLIGGLDISVWGIASASLMSWLLGVFFGYLALAVSAGTGSRRIAVLATSAVGVVAYFVNAFLPVSESLAGWAKISPFFYFQDGDPLTNGVDWSNALVLTAIALIAAAIAVPLFQRRDLQG